MHLSRLIKSVNSLLFNKFSSGDLISSFSLLLDEEDDEELKSDFEEEWLEQREFVLDNSRTSAFPIASILDAFIISFTCSVEDREFSDDDDDDEFDNEDPAFESSESIFY